MIQGCCAVPEKHNSEISSKTFIYRGFDQHGCVRTQLAALKHMCADTLSAPCKSSNTWCERLSINVGTKYEKRGYEPSSLSKGQDSEYQ